MEIFRSILCLVLAFTALIISWPALRNPHSHGFYRFFGFIATLILLYRNLPYWVDLRHLWLQILSFTLLICSLILVLWAYILFIRRGAQQARSDSPETMAFEETTRLITQGPYRFVRHPMYASLLYFIWGVFFKHMDIITFSTVIIGTLAFILTAYMEERENVAFFGEPYLVYMQGSKRFIPYIY